MKDFRKGVYFDLDTKEMSKYIKNISQGYCDVEKSFKKLGFEHRQGSGYISLDKMSRPEFADRLRKVVQENAWLTKCVKKIDVTDIGKEFDTTNFVKSIEVPTLKTIEEKGEITKSPALQAYIANKPKNFNSFGAGKRNVLDNVEE